jgi:hypothetical protein
MSVSRGGDGVISLVGDCTAQDAERLLTALLDDRKAIVDWRACDSAHTAVIQILMASGAVVEGPPRGRFLAEHVAPLLTQGRS